MVQEYLNEIAPTIYGPNKPKTSGKPLRIADLQPPASGQDKPDTLYVMWGIKKVISHNYQPKAIGEGFRAVGAVVQFLEV